METEDEAMATGSSSEKPGKTGIPPLQLQAYYDGELSSEEAAVVEAAIATHDADRVRLDALGELRELMRFDLEQRTEDVEFEGLFARIEAKLDHVPDAALVAAPEREPAWLTRQWSGLVEFFSAHRAVFVPAAVAAAIAALIVAPMLINQQPPDRVIEKERTIVIVEPLRFEGGSTGAVSYTPESNTPVIWYLGGDSPEVEPVAPVGAPKRRIRLPVEQILERLDRLERSQWPGGPLTPQAPPQDVPAVPAPPNSGPI